MRKTGAVVLMMTMIIAGGAGTAFTAFSRNDAGTCSAQFLKLGAGARAAGMGEAFGALADNADSIYWNPAGLNRVEGRALSVMHAVWFEGGVYDWAAYTQNVNGLGRVGIGVQYLSYGSVEGADDFGGDTGDFTPNDLSVALSYARKVNGIGLGMNLKYIASTLKNSASAIALDIGMACPAGETVTLAAVVQNIGTRMKFVSEEEGLPLNVKLSGAVAITPRWVAALDLNAPIDNEPVFGMGTEYTQALTQTVSAAGRLGYNSGAKDTAGLNGFSAGLGVTWCAYTIDYAFVPYGLLGETHRVSLVMKF